MKVKELIANLQEFDGELEVITTSTFGYHKLSIIKEQEETEIYSIFNKKVLEKALLIG